MCVGSPPLNSDQKRKAVLVAEMYKVAVESTCRFILSCFYFILFLQLLISRQIDSNAAFFRAYTTPPVDSQIRYFRIKCKIERHC